MCCILLVVLQSCTIRPLCIFRNDRCGCDKSKTIQLNQNTKNRVYLDYNQNYYLVLKKEKTRRKLIKFARTADEKRKFEISKGFDTLKLDTDKMDNVKLEHYIGRQFAWKRVGVMEKNSRTLMTKLRRRKFNLHCKETKSGSGGKEYADPDKNYVVFRRRFWIS